jgi:hypothetical protein
MGGGQFARQQRAGFADARAEEDRNRASMERTTLRIGVEIVIGCCFPPRSEPVWRLIFIEN